MTSARLFLSVAAPLFVLYLLTATWSLPYHVDAMTNVITAAEIATDGDAFLEDYTMIAESNYGASAPWIVPAGDSAAAQYPPGTAMLAAPLYAVWPDGGTVAPIPARGTAPETEILVPPFAPAALVAAAATAVAAGLFALVFRQFVADRLAMGAAYTFGLATGAWSVAADALWQHGPAMMWLAGAAVLSATRPVGAGFAYGAAILTRPHLALIAAGNGLWQSAQRRTIRPAVLIGGGATLGLFALVAYNGFVFGSPSITGGYPGSFAARAVSLDIPDYLGNIALALVHPERGLFIYSPFLLALIPGIPAAWRVAPDWVRGSAVGGLFYLLLQLKANRYSGGSSFWGYRYPLETLAATAPLLLLSYRQWVQRQSQAMRYVFGAAVAISVATTGVGALGI